MYLYGSLGINRISCFHRIDMVAFVFYDWRFGHACEYPNRWASWSSVCPRKHCIVYGIFGGVPQQLRGAHPRQPHTSRIAPERNRTWRQSLVESLRVSANHQKLSLICLRYSIDALLHYIICYMLYIMYYIL